MTTVTHTHVRTYIYIYGKIEIERERRERGERERERERESVVCVCVCVRERERERERGDTCGVWWVNYHHLKLLNILLISFCLLWQINEYQLDTVGEEISTLTQLLTQEILKQHAVQLRIHYGISNTKVFGCLSVNLRTVQKIRKELDEHSGDSKRMVFWKCHSDCCDKEQ